MPELPEVEISRQGIEPYLKGEIIKELAVRQPKLRWPVPTELSHLLKNQTILSIRRRAKYLLIDTPIGSIILHLGMSGKLCIIKNNEPIEKHDHVDLVMQNGVILRFNDPRRFGSILWGGINPFKHKLLAKLGPEPLSIELTAEYLYRKSRQRKSITIKQFIMQGEVVVGVGNIYACEALFRAKILPTRPAKNVSLAQYKTLIACIRDVLQESITQGGTTLRDFLGADGKPGYFKQKLQVYGHSGQPCINCSKPLKEIRIAQRTTVFCDYCQD